MSKAPITARPHVFYVRPAPGWLDLVHNEVQSIVKTPLQTYKFEPKVTLLSGAVKVHRCDWRQGLEIMMRLTTAHDVEWLIVESKCNQWSEVSSILSRVEWEDILPSRDLPVHVTADVFNGSTGTSADLRDEFCEVAGVNHVMEGGKLRFRIDLRSDFLRLSASLCGDPLYKRAYKSTFGAVAPLPEHHAAACARWVLSALKENERVGAIFVPFAGSGTFGFESILVLSGAGPGAFPRQFACELFPVTPTATMGFFRRKLSERLRSAPKVPVIFNDFNAGAVEMLKDNVAAFVNPEQFEIREGDFFKLEPNFPLEGKILTLLNPPFGNRLAKDSDVSALYTRLGSYLNDLGKKYKNRVLVGCLCPDENSWRSLSKELSGSSPVTHHFSHGGKEMRLLLWTS